MLKEKFDEIVKLAIRDGMYLQETGGVTHIAGRVYKPHTDKLLKLVEEENKKGYIALIIWKKQNELLNDIVDKKDAEIADHIQNREVNVNDHNRLMKKIEQLQKENAELKLRLKEYDERVIEQDAEIERLKKYIQDIGKPIGIEKDLEIEQLQNQLNIMREYLKKLVDAVNENGEIFERDITLDELLKDIGEQDE